MERSIRHLARYLLLTSGMNHTYTTREARAKLPEILDLLRQGTPVTISFYHREPITLYTKSCTQADTPPPQEPVTAVNRST